MARWIPLRHRMGEVPETGPAPAAIDRGILRSILLDATKEVRFGCAVVDVTSTEAAVEVHIANGSKLRAGLLVAADGATSTVRRRLLPGHDPDPLRIAGIYGRAPLDIHSLTWLPRGIVDQRRLM